MFTCVEMVTSMTTFLLWSLVCVDFISIYELSIKLVPCVRELGNVNDPYAVATMNGSDVGHIPKVTSTLCTMFISQEDALTCRITGDRTVFPRSSSRRSKATMSFLFYSDLILSLLLNNVPEYTIK